MSEFKGVECTFEVVSVDYVPVWWGAYALLHKVCQAITGIDPKLPQRKTGFAVRRVIRYVP